MNLFHHGELHLRFKMVIEVGKTVAIACLTELISLFTRDHAHHYWHSTVANATTIGVVQLLMLLKKL